MQHRDPEPFTLTEIFGDAWRSFRRPLSVHLSWNGVFMALLLVSVCGMTCGMVPIAGALGAVGGDSASSLSLGVLVVLYAVLVVVMFGLMALHQAVSLAVSERDAREEPPDLGSSFRAAVERAPAMLGAMCLRLCADLVGWSGVFALGIALLLATESGDVQSADLRGGTGAAMLAAFLLAYLFALGWVLVVRSFLGLSGPCVQHEQLGPLAAMRRSITLLSGHRLQHIGIRLAWGGIAIALYFVTYLPMGLMTAAPQVLGPDAGLLVLVALPYAVVWYFFALHLLSFDSVLEGAIYARLTRSESAEDIATVFA